MASYWSDEKQAYVSAAEHFGYRVEHTWENQFCEGELENATGACWFHDHGHILGTITELDYEDGNLYSIYLPDDDDAPDLESLLNEAEFPVTTDGVQSVIDQILEDEADDADRDLDALLMTLTTQTADGPRWNFELSDDDVKHILTECSVTLIDIDHERKPLVVDDDLLGDIHSLATSENEQRSYYAELFYDFETGELSEHLHASRNSWTERADDEGLDFVKLLAGPSGIESAGSFFRPSELEHDFQNCFEDVAEGMPLPEGFDPDEDLLQDFYDIEDVVRFLRDGRTEYDEVRDTLMIRDMWTPILCDAIEHAIAQARR